MTYIGAVIDTEKDHYTHICRQLYKSLKKEQFLASSQVLACQSSQVKDIALLAILEHKEYSSARASARRAMKYILWQ